MWLSSCSLGLPQLFIFSVPSGLYLKIQVISSRWHSFETTGESCTSSVATCPGCTTPGYTLQKQGGQLVRLRVTCLTPSCCCTPSFGRVEFPHQRGHWLGLAMAWVHVLYQQSLRPALISRISLGVVLHNRAQWYGWARCSCHKVVIAPNYTLYLLVPRRE